MHGSDVLFKWDENPDLNITPFVDVMLVLMAILMVTAPTIVYQEKITLPSGTKSNQTRKNPPLTIRMDRKRRVYLGSNVYELKSFASAFILKASSYSADSDVFIRADRSLRYADVILLLKIIKESGFRHVSLITE